MLAKIKCVLRRRIVFITQKWCLSISGRSPIGACWNHKNGHIIPIVVRWWSRIDFASYSTIETYTYAIAVAKLYFALDKGSNGMVVCDVVILACTTIHIRATAIDIKFPTCHINGWLAFQMPLLVVVDIAKVGCVRQSGCGHRVYGVAKFQYGYLVISVSVTRIAH